jgi:hypothetical protein
MPAPISSEMLAFARNVDNRISKMTKFCLAFFKLFFSKGNCNYFQMEHIAVSILNVQKYSIVEDKKTSEL